MERAAVGSALCLTTRAARLRTALRPLTVSCTCPCTLATSCQGFQAAPSLPCGSAVASIHLVRGVFLGCPHRQIQLHIPFLSLSSLSFPFHPFGQWRAAQLPSQADIAAYPFPSFPSLSTHLVCGVLLSCPHRQIQLHIPSLSTHLVSGVLCQAPSQADTAAYPFPFHPPGQWCAAPGAGCWPPSMLPAMMRAAEPPASTQRAASGSARQGRRSAACAARHGWKTGAMRSRRGWEAKVPAQGGKRSGGCAASHEWNGTEECAGRTL
eukprot:1161135-Pelagomonas_calceolata.AAC.11